MGKSLKKQPNWQSELASFIELKRSEPFNYGTLDCALLTCDAIEVITGVDVAEEYRGTYSSQSEALEIMEENGGILGIGESICERYRLEKIEPNFVGRGDPVVIRIKNQDTFGIISTCGRAVIVATPNGIGFAPKKHIVSAWRIA